MGASLNLRPFSSSCSFGDFSGSTRLLFAWFSKLGALPVVIFYKGIVITILEGLRRDPKCDPKPYALNT